MTREVVTQALSLLRRRYRVAVVCGAAIVGAATAGVVLATFWLTGASPLPARIASVTMFIVIAGALVLFEWRRLTVRRTAALMEAHAGGLDNLLVTAEQVAAGGAGALHPMIEREIFDAAAARLERVPLDRVQPLGRPALLAIGSVGALTALMVGLPSARSVSLPPPGESAATRAGEALTAGDVRVTIQPPVYAGRKPSSEVNPTAVAALEGSRVRLESVVPGTTFVDLTGGELPFAATAEGSVHEFVATESRPLLVRFHRTGETADRLVHLRVEPDERPLVRITSPGKDMMFADPVGDVAVEIEARDDVGLTALVLRYTRVSGSGETFTFEEGEWPIRVERASAGEWKGRAVFALPALKLQDGDAVVYRAVARDAKPGADPSASDSYLIEIGRLAGLASTGFALPEERDRQAISQQMLIIKTERLLAERAKMSAEEFAEQSRMLAVEQRMVKAEFVFMTGGVVEDEVEEAAHSHELAEGRMENTGQAELLSAIREMSRAEARLNAVDTAQALTFERAALRALQRAFDRRRYLLRTLPERARIDTSRRLTGELAAARSSAQELVEDAADPFVERARDVLRELSGVDTAGLTAAAVASRIIALDPSSQDLQRAAVQLSMAADDTARRDAATAARGAVVAEMAKRLPRSTSTGLRRDPLEGRLVQELPPGGARP